MSTGLGCGGVEQTFEVQKNSLACLGHGLVKGISCREAAGQIGDDNAERVLVVNW